MGSGVVIIVSQVSHPHAGQGRPGRVAEWQTAAARAPDFPAPMIRPSSSDIRPTPPRASAVALEAAHAPLGDREGSASGGVLAGDGNQPDGGSDREVSSSRSSKDALHA